VSALAAGLGRQLRMLRKTALLIGDALAAFAARLRGQRAVLGEAALGARHTLAALAPGFRGERAVLRKTAFLVRDGLAAAAVFGLVAFVISDMRHAALAYLGINPAKPAVEFEIRLPKAALSAVTDSQIELHTDRNQTLARMQGAMAVDNDGRSVLKGSVALDYRTTERVVILNLPGQPQCEFKLRLAANPSHSDQFGPWHLADRVASPTTGEETRSQQHDAFAIRYRVL
jgi:hypothetical protein